MSTSTIKSFRLSRYNIVICFMIHFLVALDALVIVPFSSTMALHLGADASQAGYLVSAYAMAAAITCLLTKGSSDINREIKRIYFYLVGITLTTWLTTFLSDFNILILCRLLTGFFGGALVVLNLNYLIQISSEEKRKQNIAILLSSFPLALAVGVPSIIVFSSGSSWQLVFQIIGSALVLMGILFFISTRNITKDHSQDLICSNDNKLLLAEALKNRDVRFSVTLAFSAVLGTFLVSTQYPVMLSVNLNISPKLLSFCYAISGVCSFITMQYYAIVKMSDLTVGRVIILLSVVMAVSIALGFRTENVDLAAIAFIVFVIVSSTRTLILVTELICSIPTQERLFLISLQNSLQHFAVGLGSMFSSLLIYSRPDLSLDFSNLIIVSLIMASGTPILWIFYRKNSLFNYHSND